MRWPRSERHKRGSFRTREDGPLYIDKIGGGCFERSATQFCLLLVLMTSHFSAPMVEEQEEDNDYHHHGDLHANYTYQVPSTRNFLKGLPPRQALETGHGDSGGTEASLSRVPFRVQG